MGISVFVSRPTPHMKKQKDFFEEISKYLVARGLSPRTIGDTDFGTGEPLAGIRRLMFESNGILTIAFARTYIEKGKDKKKADNSLDEKELTDIWITSPYCHIETAMAFQLGLPILILRQKGVLADGILERGIIETYLPEFDIEEETDKFLESTEWKQMAAEWEANVRSVVKNKGRPMPLY